MSLFKKYGFLIFWVILFVDCGICLSDNQDLASYRLYTKPLMIPILAIIFFINTKRSKHSRTKAFVYAGFLFAFLADLLLIKTDLITKNNNDNYLTLAIAMYSLGFLAYTIVFKKMNKLNIKDCQEAFLTAIVMVIGSFIFYKVLSTVELGNTKYVIFFLMIVVTLMIALAVNVFKSKLRKNIAYQFLIPASIILIISVSIIIAHRFILLDATFLPGIVVLTYGFGQLLLLRGFIKYLKA
ncbi:MAG: lysoplasmalogenase family protein [Chitinophagaceae bacterium]